MDKNMQSLLERSSAIESAFRQCCEILKCSPSDVQKRLEKMATQIKQCEEIIGELN